MTDLSQHNANKASSLVQPFKYALNKMRSNEVLSPTQYMERARMLLVDRLGVKGPIAESAFSPGVVGLMADHTHYFEGFALVLQTRQGAAVAIRPNSRGKHTIVVEAPGIHPGGKPATSQGHSEAKISTSSAFEDLNRLFETILGTVSPESTNTYDVALVVTVPAALGAAFHGSVTVTMIKALVAIDKKKATDLDIRTMALTALNAWYGCRFSPAYVIGSLAQQTEPFVLIDTGTLSNLPIEGPSPDKIAWGLIKWSDKWSGAYKDSKNRNERAQQALEQVQKNGFKNLESLRNLEHRDLEQAVEVVPRKSKGVLRFLVTENRNVQKLIIGLKKEDWQFFGALMMISQASKAADWSTTDTIHSLITKEAESAAMDGIFGVVQTGEGACMLVCGQAFSMPAFMDRAKEIAAEHTTEDVETFII